MLEAGMLEYWNTAVLCSPLFRYSIPPMIFQRNHSQRLFLLKS
jgi:hypothetical protein